MEILLAGAVVASFIAYRESLDRDTEDDGKRGVRTFEPVGPGLKSKYGVHPAMNHPRNRQYKHPIREADAQMLGNTDVQVFTPAGNWILNDPGFKAAYYANYVEAVDRDHPLLQLVRQKYPYSVMRPRIDFIGSETDMLCAGLNQQFVIHK